MSMLRTLGSRIVPYLGAGAVLLSSLLTSCAAPYLHDSGVEAQTAAVSAAWTKVDDSAYFADLRKAFTDLQASEDAALTRSLQARRNRDFAAYIAPSEAPNPDLRQPTRGVNALCSDADKRLSQLVGAAYPYARPAAGQAYRCPALARTGEMVTWSRLPAIVVNRRAALQDAQQRRADAVEQFVASRAAWRKAHPQKKGQGGAQGGAKEPALPLDCDKIALDPKAGGAASSLPDYPVSDYQGVVAACAEVNAALAEFRKDGYLHRVTRASSGSVIAGVFDRQEEARLAAERSASAAAAIEPELKTLQARIKDAGTSAASEFEDALGDVKKALADAPAAAKLIGAEQVAVILQDALKAELANPGKAKAAPAAGAEPPSVTTKRVQAIAELADAGALLADAIRANDPARRSSALMIALAAQRQRVDMLRLEAARENERMAILDAELLGATTELALLSEGRLFLTRVAPTSAGIGTLANGAQREAAQAALNRVALAWTEGRIPLSLTRLRHVYLNRAYRIKIAEKTAENWRGLIKPLIDSMNAAGAGGIPPETIGNLLSPIGVAAAVGGK